MADLIADVKIGEKWMSADFHLGFNKKVISPPQLKSIVIPIPGTSDVLDLTEAVSGSAEYDRRTIDIILISTAGKDSYYEVQSELSNYLHGRMLPIIFNVDPKYYWMGRIEIKSVEPMYYGSIITLQATVDPYKYEILTPEAILEYTDIPVPNVPGLGVEYSSYIEGSGWQTPVINGLTSGTTGQALRLEAYKISLIGTNAALYDVHYRTHVQNEGWGPWFKNGAVSGTTGEALRAEGLQVVITLAGEEPTGVQPDFGITYATHIENIGWQYPASNGVVSGTVGEALRMEAMRIWISTKTSIFGVRKKLCPRFTCTGNVVVTYGNRGYYLTPGENEVSGIYLGAGEHILSFAGSGTVTVEYTGGSL